MNVKVYKDAISVGLKMEKSLVEKIRMRYSNFTKFIIEAAEEKLEREKELKPTKL